MLWLPLTRLSLKPNFSNKRCKSLKAIPPPPRFTDSSVFFGLATFGLPVDQRGHNIRDRPASTVPIGSKFSIEHITACCVRRSLFYAPLNSGDRVRLTIKGFVRVINILA